MNNFRHPNSDSKSEGLKSLSARESEILSLLAKGSLLKEIADELHIGLGTVRTLTGRIYKKLQVHSRAQAAAKYHGEL